MQVFLDYLAATAGIVTGVLGTIFVLGMGSVAVILVLAALFNAVQRFRRRHERPISKRSTVVRPTFGKGGGFGHGK